MQIQHDEVDALLLVDKCGWFPVQQIKHVEVDRLLLVDIC